MSIERIIQEEARLTILKELMKQPNKALTSEAVRRFLLDFLLIDKPREWVEAQFQYLADLAAVDVIPAGTVKIARLTERGELHLSGHVSIAGVQRPGRV
ncbi:hypothetical protein [Rhizobium straminoryzae]|uniref:ArsR family transcriptional regulator n=1 Tax=Rhizobium straminoryzae TaxID=1387186 RepID=A0A549T814_9HYPH|nr:hypothetical protein [Rhizobium straminoryzae]TRL38022.1 hypothetical protein FNA46_13515 [Rhizobium straminoryzae]